MNVFNIIGPVMIGPSSSHTAGAVRIGRVANKILDGEEDFIELSPQNQQDRKLQHELVEQHNLQSKSIGEGANRHLRIVGGKDFNNKAS